MKERKASITIANGPALRTWDEIRDILRAQGIQISNGLVQRLCRRAEQKIKAAIGDAWKDYVSSPKRVRMSDTEDES